MFTFLNEEDIQCQHMRSIEVIVLPAQETFVCRASLLRTERLLSSVPSKLTTTVSSKGDSLGSWEFLQE